MRRTVLLLILIMCSLQAKVVQSGLGFNSLFINHSGAGNAFGYIARNGGEAQRYEFELDNPLGAGYEIEASLSLWKRIKVVASISDPELASVLKYTNRAAKLGIYDFTITYAKVSFPYNLKVKANEGFVLGDTLAPLDTSFVNDFTDIGVHMGLGFLERITKKSNTLTNMTLYYNYRELRFPVFWEFADSSAQNTNGDGIWATDVALDYNYKRIEHGVGFSTDQFVENMAKIQEQLQQGKEPKKKVILDAKVNLSIRFWKHSFSDEFRDRFDAIYPEKELVDLYEAPKVGYATSLRFGAARIFPIGKMLLAVRAGVVLENSTPFGMLSDDDDIKELTRPTDGNTIHAASNLYSSAYGIWGFYTGIYFSL